MGRAGTIAACVAFAAAGLLIAVVFDSPTSVILLVIMAVLALGLSSYSTRARRGGS